MPWKELVEEGTDDFEYDKEKNPNGIGQNQIGFFDFRGETPQFRYYHVSHGVAGDSVASDTIIRTKHSGKKKVEDLFTGVEKDINGKEYCYPDDLYVLSFDWTTNQTCYKRVKYVMRHKADKKMYRVSSSNMEYIDVTEDHSVMTYRSRASALDFVKMKNGEQPPFVETKPTEIKSSLVRLRNLPDDGSRTSKTNFRIEMYELFGFFVGDGSLSSSMKRKGTKKDIGISFGVDTDECCERILETLLDFGYITKYTKKNRNYDVRMYLRDNYIVDLGFVDENGKKVVPEWLNQEPIENIRAFLRGYFSADGGVMQRGGQSIIRLTSVIEKNIWRIKELLHICGIGSSVYSGKTENSYNGVNSGTYSKYIVIRDRQKFKDEIGFCISRKQDAIVVKETAQSKKSGGFGFSLSQCKSVEEIPYSGYVYDMEVEDTHVFFANDFLVHNTDSIYLKLPKNVADELGSLDDIIGFCDDIGELTDEFFPEFAKKAFNCPDERLGHLSTEREVVSDKSFFVTKKRYAMHIVDDEGKRVDKLKIMGLEVKKSDTSVAVKDFLMNLINMVIDGCEMTDLQKAKKQFKKDFFQMGIRDLGVPMPATKLPQYEQEYKVAGEMKGFPYHYRAAIFYNSLCGKEDREIYAGEKFYVCNIQHMDSKYIAIPLALNKNPAFVDDLVIDYEKMWEKANKKIDNYMESLGWDLKSRMEKQATDLFGM